MLPEELTKLKGRLIEYAGLVENMIDRAVKGLLNNDVELLDKVENIDEPRANEFELELEEQCTILIARFQPAAKDLRSIMMIAQMNNDLERMGDLAVNIVDDARYLSERPPVKPFIDIPQMAELTRAMVRDAINSFINEDAQMARSVCQRDNTIDEIRDQIQRELLTHMMSDPQTIDRALRIQKISSALERIADLSTNICEDTIFIIEGLVFY